MKNPQKHKWKFRARFRRHSFGWRSQPAIKRVKEAVAEIKKIARREPGLAAGGAVLFLEKLSPALEQVDSSSGAIGTAVNHAIDALVKIIAGAPSEEAQREQWLERLWNAVQEDGMGYLDLVPDSWGELCASAECASRWADKFIGTVRLAWSPDPDIGGGVFCGTTACLSSLHRAGRYEELLELLEYAPYKLWHLRQWGVKALVALGRKAEALRYAQESHGLNVSPYAIARACEEILLSSGLVEEAYERYSYEANKKSTYLATFRAICKKYSLYRSPRELLVDLVEETPGDEGKWFAAAKSIGLYKEALELVERFPADPRTLTRAARNMAECEPKFACGAGLAALKWLLEGYGYEITTLDVWEAYGCTVEAAEKTGSRAEVIDQIHSLLSAPGHKDRFVSDILKKELIRELPNPDSV